MNVPVHTPYQALPPPAIVSLSARDSTIFGLSYGKTTVSEDTGYDHRNSALLGTIKESLAPPATAHARSITSSIGAESIANGSPDKFRVLKKLCIKIAFVGTFQQLAFFLE